MSKKVLYFITSEDITGVDLAIEHSSDNDVSILLLQNAVYFANKSNKAIAQALDQNKEIFARKEDIVLRGLGTFIPDKIKLIDSDGVIDLIFENEAIINM